jgi:hypothetical protein
MNNCNKNNDDPILDKAIYRGIPIKLESTLLFESDINSRRKQIDHDLAQACAEDEKEDLSVNEEWEPTTLEGWR